MLTKTQFKFDIEPIIEQVRQLDTSERLALNYAEDGDLLGGPYLIKKEFIGTPLGNVLESLGPDIGEARLLPLGQTESYHAHRDPDDRYHLSIITSPYSYLADLEDMRLYHLPADGELWLMDTSKLHSAINLTGSQRVHLNIRVKMPKYTKPGRTITFTSGEFDWIHRVYVVAFGYINQKVKSGEITGLKKLSENCLGLNCSDEVFNHIVKVIEDENIKVMVKNDI